MRSAARMMYLLVVLLVVAVTLAGYSIVERERGYCRAQNASIDATKEVLRVSFLAPHKFNSVIDIQRRVELYNSQIHELDEAKCS